MAKCIIMFGLAFVLLAFIALFVYVFFLSEFDRKNRNN